jgi:hypothetical protein
MSEILVNCNLQTGDWTIREENIKSNYTDVLFHFSGSESVVFFNNLSFGVKLKKDSEQLHSETFGTTRKYIATENTLFDNWMENCRLYLEPNTTFTLEFWCENDGIMRTYNHEFITPDIVPVIDK